MSSYTQPAAPVEPARLPFPGLARVFHVQLILGILLSIFGGLFLIYQTLFHSMYGAEAILLIVGLLIFAYAGFLYWAESALRNRSPDAPGRCRVIVCVNMAVTLLSFIGVLVWWAFSRYGFPQEILQSIWQIPVSIVICEAWRRYFTWSPKVRAAFTPGQTPPEGEKDVPPGEIGIFMVLCWLLACSSLRSLPLFVNWFNDGVDYYPVWLLWRIGFTNLASLVMPLITLALLQQRNGVRPIFWCLGIWLVISGAGYAVHEIMFMGNGYSQVQIYPAWTYLDAYTAFPLVYWWYFATSKKGRAWCGEPEPEAAACTA